MRRRASTIYFGFAFKFVSLRNSMEDPLESNDLEAQLFLKYASTVSKDTTRHEFMEKVKKDSYACYLGRPHILMYMAACEGVSPSRERFKFQQLYASPCGPPPERPEW
eukprot:gnl/Chilomastix_cuspidata/4124.p2 GENE.gnl/Chilomastix_cuspidata/4124~~gnl/Chilomastix_cuspidata/4124.p2  ORF type:complete len:108 (+),score=13.67 gnl/Chilomastix_cuspidata/4124:47-370(+)